MQAHPGVPVVDNLEDIWRVSKLQRERKAEAEAKKKAHLARLRVRCRVRQARLLPDASWLLHSHFAACCSVRTSPLCPAACGRAHHAQPHGV